MPSTPLKYLAGIGLLALVPVGLYLSELSRPIVALSLVSVVIIAASVYVMFGPAEGDDHHAAH
jgi:hypothetical protein